MGSLEWLKLHIHLDLLTESNSNIADGDQTVILSEAGKLSDMSMMGLTMRLLHVSTR